MSEIPDFLAVGHVTHDHVESGKIRLGGAALYSSLTAHRLGKILGRLDQVTKVKGMFIHPSNADEVVSKFPEIDRYQVVVTREAHVDQMEFAVELKAGHEPTEALAEQIEQAIPGSMRVRGKVTFLKTGTLPEEYKTIEDRREWD